MEQLWHAPRPEVGSAIRRVAETLIADPAAIVATISAPSLQALGPQAVAEDPMLSAEDGRANQSDLLQWLTSNVQHPGLRVPPHLGPELHDLVRDLQSRGITPDFASAWHAAVSAAWPRWLEACFAHVEDRTVLREVLDVSARSIVQFCLDSLEALRAAQAAGLAPSTDAQLLAALRLVLDGTQVSTSMAEAQLGHRLTGEHTAMVLWRDGEADPDDTHASAADAVPGTVEAAAREVARGRSALVVRPSPTLRWLWLPTRPGSEAPGEDDVRRVLRAHPGVRAALGRPAEGVEGFRSSHAEAIATQAVLLRSESPRRVGSHAEWDLVDALTRDRRAATAFVRRTLGDLAEADEVLREALLTYVQTGFSTTRTAERIFAHRNTAERRVARASALCATSVDDRPAEVAAALLVRHLADPDQR